MENLCGKPTKNELELINRYTRRELSEDEVYVFSIVLCDNEIDRDFERFPLETLTELEKLFVGVTGVLDHIPQSKNQTARIFSCKTEILDNRLTSDGIPYARLHARAYIPKSKSNDDFILALDSGIRKEVSVGCSVKKHICSICGEDIRICGHIKGKSYDNRLCYSELIGAGDAYEWSFVAVPAQKNAGVIKSYSYGGNKNTMNNKSIETKLFSDSEQAFSAEELKELAKSFNDLKEKAYEGEIYRSELEQNTQRLMRLVLPELTPDTAEAITKAVSIDKLKELYNAAGKKSSELFPIKPQLFNSDSNKNRSDNKIYTNI